MLLSSGNRTGPDIHTIGILTSGGDAPGMNAAIWSVCRSAEAHGWRVMGVRHGFEGLERGNAYPLGTDETLPWVRLGGTRLGTSRLQDFPSHASRLIEAAGELGLDKLVVLGGNGSLAACALLAEAMDVVGIPATIDNDVADSEESIGFDTACNTALVLLDGIRDTAESMPRLFALQTLGGDTGFLARAVASAGAADQLLVPEVAVDEDEVSHHIAAVLKRRRYAIVVASEGFRDLEGFLDRLADRTGTRYRLSQIGHAQRGGRPTARDRRIAIQLSEAAVRALADGRRGRMLWRHAGAELLPFGSAAVRPYLRESGEP